MPPVRGKKSGRGYADMAAALARSREKSARAKSNTEKEEETPQPQPSVSSVRSTQSSQRRYYSPYHQATSVKSKKAPPHSSTSTPHTAKSSGTLDLEESPRFSNTFKEARRAVCDLYTIWKHEYDEKEKHANESNANEGKDGKKSGGMGSSKYEDSSRRNNSSSKNDDGKLELSSKAVEYLQETIGYLEDEAKYFQVSMEAFHKGMISVMDKNKGVDVDSINKKNLREKGVPLKELKTERTELHKEEKDKDLEKKLEESQKKHSDMIAQLCEAQNKISEQDLDLRSILVELKEAKKEREVLSTKCASLNTQLDEEVNRSSETLRELQRSQGSKDGQVQSLVDGMQGRLDSKIQQCNDLQSELAHYKEEQELYKNEIADLKKEMQAKEEESGKKLELTRSDVEKLSIEYKTLKDSIGLEDQETGLKLEAALETIKRQAGESETLKKTLGESEAKTSQALQSLYEKENEILQLSEQKESKLSSFQRGIEAKVKEMQGLNDDLASTLAQVDGAKHLSSILTAEINKGLQNYLDDLVEAKTPRSICSSANPFSQSVVGNRDSAKSRTVEEDEEEQETAAAAPATTKSLDQILSSNGMGGRESADVFVEKTATAAAEGSDSESLASVYSFLSELGIVKSGGGDMKSGDEKMLGDIKAAIKGVVSKTDEMKLVAQQQEMDFIKSEETSKTLQAKLRNVESELEELKFQPEISIGSAVVSPSRSRSHTVDNAVFKEHASLSELPEMMIREDEDIQFSSSEEDEAVGPDSPSLARGESLPVGGRRRDRTFSSTRSSKSMFLRQNSNQITEGIAEDLRIENDSLRIKLTQLEVEKEGLTLQLKEKEKEIGKQTTREMETIRRASVMYDSKAQQSQKGFWQGKRNRGSSNAEDMQTLVNDLTTRYSDLSLKFAEKCSEADELTYQLKTKDVEIGAIKELYAIPDILEQNNNVWVSFRVFIPGDDEKGIATSLLVGTDGIYVPHWVDQQFYDYTTIAKFEVRDNEFVFWCLTTTSRKLNEVNLYCNAVLPNAILSSIQSAIKMKLEVHNTATSSITVG